MRNCTGKSEFFSLRIENFLDRIDDLLDLKTDWRRWLHRTKHWISLGSLHECFDSCCQNYVSGTSCMKSYIRVHTCILCEYTRAFWGGSFQIWSPYKSHISKIETRKGEFHHWHHRRIQGVTKVDETSKLARKKNWNFVFVRPNTLVAVRILLASHFFTSLNQEIN